MAELIVAACVVGVTALASLGVWVHHRRIAPANITDELREQRKLAEQLGTSLTPRVTVDTRLMPHEEVLDLAAAQGYATSRWYPDAAGGTVYDFECRVAYPPPCAMTVTRGWGRS